MAEYILNALKRLQIDIFNVKLCVLAFYFHWFSQKPNLRVHECCTVPLVHKMLIHVQDATGFINLSDSNLEIFLKYVVDMWIQRIDTIHT